MVLLIFEIERIQTSQSNYFSAFLGTTSLFDILQICYYTLRTSSLPFLCFVAFQAIKEANLLLPRAGEVMQQYLWNQHWFWFVSNEAEAIQS